MLQTLQRLALSKALRGQGSRVWVIVGTAAWLLRTANRLRQPTPEVVYRSELKAGQTLIVDHLAIDHSGKPTGRRRSRRSRR